MNEERLPFFVYGTLLPGQPNAYLWGNSVTESIGAKFPGGCLYDMGAYPMLVEGGDCTVVGMLLSVFDAKYETILSRLDRLEGYDPDQPDETWYRRVKREVLVDSANSEQGQDDRLVSAWVYVGYPLAVQGMHPVPNGDWAAYSAKTFRDIEARWRHVESVHRLQDSGEESK